MSHRPEPDPEPPVPVVWLRRAELSARSRRELDRVVDIAIGIADRDGLDALTMRRLAAAAETGTTTLYRYLHSRDDLLDLMADTAHAVDDLSDRPSGDWQADMAVIARALRDIYLRHPWLPTLFVTVGPNTLRLADLAASVTLAVAPDAATAQAINSALMSFVRGAALAEVTDRVGRTQPAHADAHRTRARTEWQHAVISGGSYPAFVQVARAAHQNDQAELFEFGLARLIDGIETLLHKPAGP